MSVKDFCRLLLKGSRRNRWKGYNITKLIAVRRLNDSQRLNGKVFI